MDLWQCLAVLFMLLLFANFLLKLSPLSTGSFKLGSTIEGANLSQALSF